MLGFRAVRKYVILRFVEHYGHWKGNKEQKAARTRN